MEVLHAFCLLQLGILYVVNTVVAADAVPGGPFTVNWVTPPPQVVVIGTSGGGTTAFNFALRHPDRCAGCMTEVAVSGDFNHPKIEELKL